MAIQIGKYKRPAIFLEEFDNSVITTPTVEGIAPLVMGFSKKGAVNTPILLKTVSDLEAVFGTLDHTLEKKGSFFHRTLSKVLESNNVYAINMLKTDDTLDTLEYRSFSTAAQYTNDIVRTDSYRKFFDTSAFWKRDTESFLNVVNNDLNASQRALNFTNMSDKNISVFVFKSKRTGFDVTFLDWYGTLDKVPTYVYSTDYISDYMLDVICVAGDWTDYHTLSVDTKWGAYFNPSGLRKEQVTNFTNDRNVNVLAYYSGVSMIPFFRDQTNKNIYIETVVNRDTDKTGLFCSFNSDLLETDKPNGIIDIIGNSLINDNGTLNDIDFLSYKDTVNESIDYSQKFLDSAGNVMSLGATASGTNIYRIAANGATDRTAHYAEGYVYNVTGADSATLDFLTPIPSPAPTSVIVGSYGATSSIQTVNYIVGVDSYAVIGGNKVDIAAGTYSFTFSAASFTDALDSNSTGYMSVFTLDASGAISKIDNTTNNTPVEVNATDIVLGYVNFSVFNNTNDNITYFTAFDYEPVTVKSTGFIELVNGTDYTVSLASGSLTYTFLNTNVIANTGAYKVYRRFKLFNYMTSFLNSPNKDKMTLVIDNNEKRSLSTMTVTNIITASSLNKTFTLNTNLTNSSIDDLSAGNLCLYALDDEFILNDTSLVTKNTPYAGIADGIVAKYSSLYKNYVDGAINTGDYFYENILGLAYNIEFADYSGQDYIIFYGQVTAPATFLANDKIRVPSAVSNNGDFTILSSSNYATSLGLPSGYFAYKVSENTTSEILTGVTKVYNVLNKIYLEMYLDSSSNLKVKFVDSTFTSANVITDITKNLTLTLFTQKSNYKQSLEIEVPSGYTVTPNKVLINGTRYTEVKVGDYLEAYVDSTLLTLGEVPKRMTRIISKKLYANDTTLVELTCDARIKTYDFAGDLQTYRFTSIEDYITTYKGTKLKGFNIRLASMPDGTETRQSDILNVFAKGTNLYKAITNKEAIEFRYMVDSFGLGLTERSKQQLVDIAGERLDTFAFLNMPSMKSFKNSSSPSFVDSEGNLKIEFVSQGGDQQSNPAFLYSFGDGRGVSCAGYFAPYLTVNDNGRPLNVPPAMYVANTYLRKFNTTQTNILPWTICAGVTNGQVTNIADVEYNFTPEDIEFLNTMKANPIVRKRNRGIVIETENTAQTLVRSALSYIHSREVLIELEKELAGMLLNFQWKFNTPEVRAEIKFRADSICQRFVNRNGLYAFFNKCDDENNTSEMIDSQIGALDTYVEIAKGLATIVNNVTILRTGAIQSGGFLTI